MSGENDRIPEIGIPKRSSDYDTVRDEIIRMSGVFSTLGQLRSQDIDRLASKAYDVAGRVVILSQILFPQLCTVIGRGLTLEEIGLLVGTDQLGIKNTLKRPEIRNKLFFVTQKADNKKFVKVTVPLKATYKDDDGSVEDVPMQEPFLAPVQLVNEIKRNGYITKDGRVLRHDYLSMISGPLPTVYIFQNNDLLVQETMGADWKKTFKGRMADDPGAAKADMEIAIAQLEFIKPLFISDLAQSFFTQTAEFFHETYQNTIRYAWRYDALKDRATFEKIEALANPFLFASEGIWNSDWLNDEKVRKMMVDAIEETISEFRMMI